MNWTEIEAKWTAMTRRVKSDQTGSDVDVMISGSEDEPLIAPDKPSAMRKPPPLDRPKN